MELTISNLDFAPGAKSDPEPFVVTLLRELPGPDRPDYWLAELHEPIHWTSEEGDTFDIGHVVLATRWENTSISEGATRVPIGVAYVTDPSLVKEDGLDLAKIHYVAGAVADDTTDGRPIPSFATVLAANFAGMFKRRPRE